MKTIRVGTRGSDLALWQTRWVESLIRQHHLDVQVEEIIITTEGDVSAINSPDVAGWTMGAFVGAIESALTNGEIDYAVHSCKDLPSESSEGLTIAAFPPRAAVNDVLITREEVNLDVIPTGFKVGTSSPRRKYQFLRHADVEILPLRGNVPTRIKKLVQGDYDGIILALAGIERLELDVPFMTVLPSHRFVPAPAQGAVAVQSRSDSDCLSILKSIDHSTTRKRVEAERAFLAGVAATCDTPVGALATIDKDEITLAAQLFSDDGNEFAEGTERGKDPVELGRAMAKEFRTRIEA